MAKPKVYRVEEIPEDLAKHDISDLFVPTCRPRIQVTSLSQAADWSEQNCVWTATFLYSPEDALDKPKLLSSQLSVDSDFYRFTPYFTPSGAIDADVIALPGLAGHAFGSWAVSVERMWIRDFLRHDLPNCRVLTYGYDSRLETDESRAILFDYSNNFVVKLQDMRRQGRCLDRPIVFIGQSLGCLIIKEALINFRSFVDQGDDNQKDPPVVCLTFFGAPHRGLNVAAMQTLVEGRPSEDLIRELKRQSPTLTRLNADFKRLYGDFNILTIYEMRDTPSVRQREDGSWDKEGPLVTMVEKDSAILYWENEQTIGLTQNNRQIAKVNRGQSGCYNQIRGFILSSLEQRLKVPAKAFTGEGIVYFSSSPYGSIISIDEFFLAVRNGASRGIQALLDRGTLVNSHRGDRHTALHVAAEWATIEVIQLLLENGACVGNRNADGWTPLHFASRFNSVASIVLLLRAGANVSELTENDKCTPLHLAARYNRSASVAAFLTDAGAELDARELNGWTPLHFAVRYGNRLEIVDCLLRKGAAVNASNDESYTALHLAAGHGTTAVLEALLDLGAELEARDSDGSTPLHWAVRFGQDFNVSELLRRGANPQARSKTMMLPANVGFVETVPERTRDQITTTMGKQ